jgi:hypothetical protein
MVRVASFTVGTVLLLIRLPLVMFTERGLFFVSWANADNDRAIKKRLSQKPPLLMWKDKDVVMENLLKR